MCPQRVSVIPGLSAAREFLLTSILSWPGTVTLALHRAQVRFVYLETFLLYSSVKGPLIPNPAYFLWDDSWLSGQSRSKDTRVSLKMFPAGCVSTFESHPGKPGHLFTRKKLLLLFVLFVSAIPNLIRQGHQRGQRGSYQ